MLVLFCKQWSCVCSVGETESCACCSSGWVESALRMLFARELLVDSLLLPCCMSSARGLLSSGCSSVLCVSVLAGSFNVVVACGTALFGVHCIVCCAA